MKESKRIAKMMEEGLAPEEMLDGEKVAEQIRMMADEDEGFSNRIFEIGVSQVVKKCKKLMFIRD